MNQGKLGNICMKCSECLAAYFCLELIIIFLEPAMKFFVWLPFSEQSCKIKVSIEEMIAILIQYAVHDYLE